MNGKIKKAALFISGGLTAVICLVMNLILIPRIESSTDGIKCFDMNFGYSADTAKRFLELISNESRSVYLNIQLPLDFIYPLAYCTFFVLMLLKFAEKRKALAALPVVLAVSDYTENICSIIMLKSAEFSPALASFASAVTCIKTVLMYITFLIIIVSIIIHIKNKKKKVQQ